MKIYFVEWTTKKLGGGYLHRKKFFSDSEKAKDFDVNLKDRLEVVTTSFIIKDIDFNNKQDVVDFLNNITMQ